MNSELAAYDSRLDLAIFAPVNRDFHVGLANFCASARHFCLDVWIYVQVIRHFHLNLSVFDLP